MATPPTVTALCQTFLDAADAAAPGLVTGLYLCGSVALDDFHPTGSDVDFVAVLDRPADPAALAALDAAHRTTRERHPGEPALEGTHVTLEALAAGPAGAGTAPSAFQGAFHPDDRFALNPVTWHELAGHGVAVRGPAVADLDVWHDDAVLRAYTVDNLTSYWRERHKELDAAAEEIVADPAAAAWSANWVVLGVSRLHRELALGGLTTKCGGGGFALTAFDARWHPLVIDCLGIRAGHPSRYGSTAELHRDTVDFLDLAIDAALARA